MWCVRQTHYKIQQLGIGVFKRLPFAYGYIMDNVQEQIPGEPKRLPCLEVWQFIRGACMV